jgi:hypothetical protein
MSAETSLRTYFLSKTAITDLAGTRIGSDQLAQNAVLPAIVLTRTSSRDEHILSNLAGAVQARIQVESFADTRLVASDLAKKVKRCGIAAVKGTYDSTDFRGVTVEDSEREYVDYPTDGSDEHRYVTSFDLLVSYLED